MWRGLGLDRLGLRLQLIRRRPKDARDMDRAAEGPVLFKVAAGSADGVALY